MTLHLIDKDDVISHRGKKEKDDIENASTGRTGTTGRVVVKKEKKEKSIRVVRVKFYERISLPHMIDGKMEHIDIFAVDRSLEDLLRSLYFNTNIQGMITPPDCIFVEKDNRMGNNNKFIFIEISKDEFGILKKEMENYRTIQGYNKGEFIIMEGGRKSLAETFDMPRIRKDNDVSDSDVLYNDVLDNDNYNNRNKISDTNKIIMREKLREELKDELKSYHSCSDEKIDHMKEKELIELKKIVNEKIKIENRKRKLCKVWK